MAKTAKGAFDFDSFYQAVDAQRRAGGLTWKQIARETGISASALTRMSQGSRPDLDTVATLASWAGLDLGIFGTTRRNDGHGSMAMISAYLRRDPTLSPDAARALEQVIAATYAQLRSH